MIWKSRQRNPDFVKTVYSAKNKASELLARTLLDSAGIECVVRSDVSQDLFGWGRLGSGSNFITGPVTFAVKPEDFDNAKKILAEILEIKPNPIPLRLRVVAIMVLLLPLLAAILSLIKYR